MNAQGSEAWHQEKLGHASASIADDICAEGRAGAPSATRENAVWEKALERLTGMRTEDAFTGKHKDRGTALEPSARRHFEAASGIIMLETGFIKHPTIPWVGASPDGISIDHTQGMEAKCRLPKGHGLALAGKGVAAVQKQVDFQMWVCDFDVVWFVSYCPAFPPELRLHFEPIQRDEERIAIIAKKTLAFLADVERTINQLRAMIEARKERKAA